MAVDIAQFHHIFFEESFEGLDTMESGLLHLNEGEADAEVVNTVFRAAHSIKGGSSTFGFNDVAGFTHVMETLLDEVREGQRQVTQETVALLLQSVDCLREMLTAGRDGTEIDQPRVSHLQQQLEDLLHGEPHEERSPTSQAADGQSETVSVGWHIRFHPHPHMLRTGNDPVRMFQELAALGKLTVQADMAQLPALTDLDPEECFLAWDLTVQGDISREQVSEIFEWVEDDCFLEIMPLQAETPDPEKPSSSQRPESPATDRRSGTDRRAGAERSSTAPTIDTGSIRVSIDKIDALINLVGELVITQSMLGQLGDDFDVGRLEYLRDGLAQLERNTRELQENVMRIRMLPISFAFNRFPRLVHDLSQQLGKQIELKMSGEQTELDKTVMEKIGDPLVHLVRNALDHGIEAPQARQEAGKPATGLLHLNASHQGGNIVIEISDDGAGLHKEKILHKAIERGLATAGEVLSDEKICDLIFHPGFSTADVVSDVSGRGVGMDVVRRNIQELGGNIEVQSQEGEGSTFIIRLPLTLAILDGQLIRVGEETYIVPLVSIIESLQINAKHVDSIAGRAELYKLRDDYIPILRFYEVFNLVSNSTELAGALLVVVEGDGQKVGLVVDELLGQQQVVIKSLETNFHRVEGLSGATILGDGTVALILDIAGLIRVAHGR